MYTIISWNALFAMCFWNLLIHQIESFSSPHQLVHYQRYQRQLLKRNDKIRYSYSSVRTTSSLHESITFSTSSFSSEERRTTEAFNNINSDTSSSSSSSNSSSSNKRIGRQYPTSSKQSSSAPVRIKKHKWKSYNHKNKSSPIEIKKRLDKAKIVEERLYQALDDTKKLIASCEKKRKEMSSLSHHHHHEVHEEELESHKPISFPSVRECNSALAILGDTNDFKKALRLFGQMRKSQMLVSLYNANNEVGNTGDRMYLYPPSPTLVTYSTLMSRAVSLGKYRVALRLWRLMTLQKEFFTNLKYASSTSTSTSSLQEDGTNISSSNFGAPIVPDIKAVNILMNVFAKMGDQQSAKMLMEQLDIGDVERFDPTQQQDEQNTSISSSSTLSSSKSSAVGAAELEYLIRVVPKLKPTIVTYNTLIDACHRSGDLDAALDALSHMKSKTRLKPDAKTYTSLISTVARRDTRASGSKDPDLAFALFDEMIHDYGIRPNGMTYCALIDVCGRCGRSDLALKGLRMMLRERVQRKHMSRSNHNHNHNQFNNDFEHEVGAWSAAINACGKAGRLDTAMKIFHTMRTKFNVKPNIITCGCLMDCLLKSRNSNDVKEALNVLVYMQDENIQPSEVMYTSLITSAGRLARIENEKRGELVLTDFGDRSQSKMEGKNRMKALDVYEELLLSLTNAKSHSKHKVQSRATDTSNNLVKAFLIFQEMKATGADPDIACYNALLRACAASADIPKMFDVMRRIETDCLTPNDTTWKEYLRGAAKAKNSQVAEEVWNNALTYKNEDTVGWIPNVDSFVLLLASYALQASEESILELKSSLYGKIIDAYLCVLKGDTHKGFNNVDINVLKENRRGMSIILKAIDFQVKHDFAENEDDSEDCNMYENTLIKLFEEIRQLACFQYKKRKL